MVKPFGVLDIYRESIPMEGKEQKQDWAKGRFEPWCNNKALDNSGGLFGAYVAH